MPCIRKIASRFNDQFPNDVILKVLNATNEKTEHHNWGKRTGQTDFNSETN